MYISTIHFHTRCDIISPFPLKKIQTLTEIVGKNYSWMNCCKLNQEEFLQAIRHACQCGPEKKTRSSAENSETGYVCTWAMRQQQSIVLQDLKSTYTIAHL